MTEIKGKRGGARLNAGRKPKEKAPGPVEEIKAPEIKAQAWGGKRQGAGRKPKAKAATAVEPPPPAVQVELEPQPHGGALKRAHEEAQVLGQMDMLAMLQAVALGKVNATSLQVRAAIAAVQYTHTKRHDGGKKDEVAENAKKVAGRFSAAAPPRLAAAGGKNV